MSVGVQAALTAIGTALDGIDGLRVFAYIPDSIVPPAAVVDVEEIVYDHTMGRGTDRATFVVTVAVGKAHDRSSHVAVTTYLEGSGAKSVKAALDAIGPAVRVTDARKSIVLFASQEFLGATFSVDYVA